MRGEETIFRARGRFAARANSATSLATFARDGASCLRDFVVATLELARWPRKMNSSRFDERRIAVPRPKHVPIVLIVRDGWGKNPFPEWNHANAIDLAKHPVDDRLL